MILKFFYSTIIFIILLSSTSNVSGETIQGSFTLNEEQPVLTIFDTTRFQHRISLTVNVTYTNGTVRVSYDDWDVGAWIDITNGTAVEPSTLTTFVKLKLLNGSFAQGSYDIIDEGREISYGDLLVSVIIPITFLLIRKRKTRPKN